MVNHFFGFRFVIVLIASIFLFLSANSNAASFCAHTSMPLWGWNTFENGGGSCGGTSTAMVLKSFVTEKKMSENANRFQNNANNSMPWLLSNDRNTFMSNSFQLVGDNGVGTSINMFSYALDQVNQLEGFYNDESGTIMNQSGNSRLDQYNEYLTAEQYRENKSPLTILAALFTTPGYNHAMAINGADGDYFIVYDPWYPNGSVYNISLKSGNYHYVSGDYGLLAYAEQNNASLNFLAFYSIFNSEMTATCNENHSLINSSRMPAAVVPEPISTPVPAAAPTTDLPSVNLTVNGVSNHIIVSVGQPVEFAWSSKNAISASSSYYVSSGPNGCSHATSPTDWGFYSSSNIISTVVPECEAGSTYILTINVTDANGRSASSTVEFEVQSAVQTPTQPTYPSYSEDSGNYYNNDYYYSIDAGGE